MLRIFFYPIAPLYIGKIMEIMKTKHEYIKITLGTYEFSVERIL